MTDGSFGRLASISGTTLLVACALVMTVLAIRREVRPPAVPGGSPIGPQRDWLAYAKMGHRVGPDDARVLLIDFSDYQCPFCKQFEARLSAMRHKYPRDVAVIYRDWPLTGLHRQAMNAAVASECAAQQGNFESMHQVLFDAQDSLGVIPWEVLAKRAAVSDVSTFASCMVGTAAPARVQQEIDAAKPLNIPGTPVLLMSGMHYRGALSESKLDSLIVGALKEQGARAR